MRLYPNARIALLTCLHHLQAGAQRILPADPPPLLISSSCSPLLQVGRRLTGVTILSGSVVRIWDSLERVLGRHEMELSKSDRCERLRWLEGDCGELRQPLMQSPKLPKCYSHRT